MSSKKGLGLLRLVAVTFLFRGWIFVVVGLTFSVLASTAGVSTVSVFGGLGTTENIGNILCNKSAYPITERAALVGIGYQYPLWALNKTVSIKS